MKNIRWSIIMVSLICGILFGLVVGVIFNNAPYGLIAFGAVTFVILMALCLVSMNN